MQVNSFLTTHASRMKRFLPYFFSAFIGFAIADISILWLRPELFPDRLSLPAKLRQSSEDRPGRSFYAVITSRNFLRIDPEIPPELRPEVDDSNGNEQIEQPPVLSQLPVSLVGTIVHANPAKSVATIEVKGKNKIAPYSVGENMEGLARIQLIERKRVVFLNLNNNQREYIEIPSDVKISFNTEKKTTSAAPQEVKQVGENRFSLNRENVLKHTSDFGSLLQQARAIPNRDPRTGEINGFKIMNIMPDSIFGQLGVKVNDVIKGVNGEPVTSPQKAMQLYQSLRTEDRVEITVERGGNDVKLEYQIE